MPAACLKNRVQISKSPLKIDHDKKCNILASPYIKIGRPPGTKGNDYAELFVLSVLRGQNIVLRYTDYSIQ